MRTLIAALIIALILAGCSEIILLPNRSYRFLVTFDTGAEFLRILHGIRAAGIQIVDRLDIVNGIACYLDEDQMEAIKALPSVRYIEPDLELFMLESDYHQQLFSRNYQSASTDERIDWGVNRIRAPDAWGIATGKDIRVGVIDTGIASGHPDLQGAVIDGYNAIDGGSYQDDNDHGTYVASVLAARRNGTGIVGVAPEALLYAIKVMSSDGRGYISDVIQGCQWAMDQRIPIVNMSLGSDYHSTAIRETMSIAASQGMSIIAAAGNDGERGVLSPAREEVAVCVGGSGTHDQRMSWSNYGAALKRNGVLAPGDWIMAGTKDGGWRRVAGTSIAAPHVTGIFALLLEVEDADRECLRRFVFESASRSSAPDEFSGRGVVDARTAIDAMMQDTHLLAGHSQETP